MSEISYLERSKKEWIRAGDFPVDKEKVYPDHTIAQEFDHVTDKRVYEYGIGGGSDLMSYLRRGNTVWGTDIVPENIEASRKHILEAGFTEDKFNLVLLEDSHPLPFNSESFDIISSHGVLHHIKEPEPVVKEFYRVMRPDGRLYIMLYSTILWDHFKDLGMIDNFMLTYGVSKEEAFCYCTDNIGAPYAIPYTIDMASELLSQAGFVLDDYMYWNNDFFITFKACKLK